MADSKSGEPWTFTVFFNAARDHVCKRPLSLQTERAHLHRVQEQFSDLNALQSHEF